LVQNKNRVHKIVNYVFLGNFISCCHKLCCTDTKICFSDGSTVALFPNLPMVSCIYDNCAALRLHMYVGGPLGLIKILFGKGFHIIPFCLMAKLHLEKKMGIGVVWFLCLWICTK